MSNFMKIRPLGAELFHADDRRADMTKLIIAFRNFVNAPKNGIWGVDWLYLTLEGNK